jgi:uncharacterized membrane protein YphA (DoxX/SURF4 family)
VVSATMPVQSPGQTSAAQPWSLATRIAFRFCFVFFGLYCLSTQIITSLIAIPTIDLPDPSSIPPWRPIITFTATRIFRHKDPLVFTGSGSGDKTVDLVLLFCLLVFSLLATAVWSILDRRRTSYSVLHKWFVLCLRFALAGQMLSYGFAKAVPLQMPFPGLFTLIEPFGNMSPMGVLWSSVGASQHYEIAAGCLELLGGILLFIPRTTTLGALISLADMSYVFLLNMTYDVPVKLLSFQLVFMSLFLLAPDFRRLLNFFFLNRTAEPSPKPPLFRTPRANHIALAAQAVFAIWLVTANIWGARIGWKQYGPGAPKPALYGIWDVEQFSTDGQLRPPLLTDNDRWHRILFDYETMELEHMDSTTAFCSAAIDAKKNTLALTHRRAANAKLNFTFARPAADQLILDGNVNGHKTHIQLRLEDRNKFLLVSRGFHWIQEYPYNR